MDTVDHRFDAVVVGRCNKCQVQYIKEKIGQMHDCPPDKCDTDKPEVPSPATL